MIACIAMVLGWTYEAVVDQFHNDFDKKGMDGKFAKEFICEHRYSCVEKRGTHYGHVAEHNKRLMVPFAPIHIVTVQQFKDLPKQTHAIVMDSKGRIYDPHDVKLDSISFYEAIHIMGFWKD
jgi:hypothetical protein